ncbi:Lipase EstA/Esterase EstB family-containing protein [Strongyloides ratti]|uniref:Lipase EstA/Esterase EstB family-containing protein n=1 Tax=Strongyloides ratti TaxID=34506 RepID=A0A090LSC0_STRRB|nr:Lipase EstA/Esterase EstB family-containing protein [Strongyloides ratti]CEF71107.1 Lipase EstA/Esterase EstB family-containing protein [Strongyloides ratti]
MAHSLLLFSFFIGINYIIFLNGLITNHFYTWLQLNGYHEDDFPSLIFGNNGSFGGKDTEKSIIKKRPVIFIHGNGDGALDDGSLLGSGWNSSLNTFLNNGYTMKELYGITWGDRIMENNLSRTFDCKYVKKIRRFILAVLKYTKFNSINIVSHSMGVTLTRKAIKGGAIKEKHDVCNIGEPISKKINTFNGYWPGNDYGYDECGIKSKNEGRQNNYSNFLQNLNEDKYLEGQYIINIFSTQDEVIGNNNIVFNKNTSRLSTITEQFISDKWSHIETKDKSSSYVIEMIKKYDD